MDSGKSSVFFPTTEVGTQGLVLATGQMLYHFNHTASPFCLWLFFK
jgi:hypothetical protein